MALVLLSMVCTREPGDLSFANWGKGRVARELDQQLSSLTLGTNTGVLDVLKDPSFAAGVLALSSASGTVGGVIGGKTVTVTAAGGDAPTADLIAAAIASSAAAGFVTAVSRAASQTVTLSSASGVVTITVNAPAGAVSNSSMAGIKSYSATWATSDTATASALVALINADGGSPVFASSSAGVVTLYARPGASPSPSGTANTLGNLIIVSATGTGVTAGGAALAGGGSNANVIVSSISPGSVGTGVTLAASGTGVTAPSGASLVAGAGTPGTNTFTC
jgi:hypothetical protein